MANSGQNYAGFGRRSLAYFIDGVLIGIVNFILSFALASTDLKTLGALLGIIIGWGYLIYFTGSRGQTLGKKAMGIKVIKLDTGNHPDYVSAFLREIVGRFISGLVLLLGYLWVIWDPKKQGWHDKIANTVVVKV